MIMADFIGLRGVPPDISIIRTPPSEFIGRLYYTLNGSIKPFKIYIHI